MASHSVESFVNFTASGGNLQISNAPVLEERHTRKAISSDTHDADSCLLELSILCS
jgi:hypothetical protein